MKIERNKPFNPKNMKETINATNLLGLHCAVANQRRRKKLIQVLDGPDGRVVETKDMIQVVVDYYKTLSGHEGRHNIRLKTDFF
jgi:RNase P/RNase MRP subunit p29